MTFRCVVGFYGHLYSGGESEDPGSRSLQILTGQLELL